MRRKTWMGAAALCATLSVAGCGTAAVTTPPVKQSTAPKATPVPAPLANYARGVSPVLQAAINQAQSLASTMKSKDLELVGANCAAAGPSFSSLVQAFKSVPAPAAARGVASGAAQAFKLLLSSTDECGLATDNQSRSQLKQASADLKTGSYRLWRQTNSLRRWLGGVQ